MQTDLVQELGSPFHAFFCASYNDPSPLGEKVPEGRMRGPSSDQASPPHQFGQTTYARICEE